MSTIDRDLFFQRIRSRPFGGRLSPKQATGCTAILDYWGAKHANRDDRWLAYILGTAYHETAHRMESIHEYGSEAYFNRRYGPNTRVGKNLGNMQAGDGARFHGRGFVQLTGRANYRYWKKRLGTDLLGNPDLALKTDVAAKILIDGSIGGTFTGAKLSYYFQRSRNDWLRARQIINRMDRAQHIANLALQFYAAISHTDTGQSSQAAYRPVLSKGSEGEDVRFLQLCLGLAQDGRFGPMTHDVVTAFQKDKGMKSDGIVGRKSWARILQTGAVQPLEEAESSPEEIRNLENMPLLRFGSRGDAVKQLQSLLQIKRDGDFGPKTLEAVKEFQARHGLQADGIIGKKTWAALGANMTAKTKGLMLEDA